MTTGSPVADVFTDLTHALARPGADGAALERVLSAAASWWRSLRPAERRRTRAALRERIAAVAGDRGLFHVATRSPADGERRDHSVLRCVLENRPSGVTGEAERFDRWLLVTPALAALRARRRFFHRELRLQLANAPIDRAVRILAFGAGPLPEALDVLDERRPSAPPAEVVLVDAALAEAESARHPRVTCHPGDAREFFGSPPAPPVDLLADLDFAYSPYLCDRLGDADLRRSIDALFERLRPGGQLVLAHYDGELTDRDRLVLEAWLDWSPRYRSRRELARLLDRTDAKRHGHALGLVRGPNVYVVIQRNRTL